MSIVTAISAYLGITPKRVTEIAAKAPTLYRRYSVPKRRGGYREIYHPAKETKTIQTAAIDLLDSDDLVHECVKGYVRGLRSPLLKNANEHCMHQFLLRLDFADFFPSIKPEDFKAVCGGRLRLHRKKLSKTDLEFLCGLFFVFNKKLGWFLGIGAPSSPFVSNWVMYQLDGEVLSACSDLGVAYTRYVDDLYFSANSKKQLLLAEKTVVSIVKACSQPTLKLNPSKRTLGSKWSRRRVTGLTITPTGEVKVPRSTKRFIRTLLYRYACKALTPKDRASLSGYLAFMNDCEPTYFSNSSSSMEPTQFGML